MRGMSVLIGRLKLLQANLTIQISDERKSKAVGIVRINLGTYITE